MLARRGADHAGHGRRRRSWRPRSSQAVTRQRVPACCPAGSARTSCSTCGAGSSTTSRGCRWRSTSKYTSGRVISRLTSDIDAIDELLEAGFDGLVTAVLTLVGTAVLLLVLDVQLGAGRAAVVPAPAVASRAGSGASRPMAYRRTRETVALVIVHFVESMAGIRAVQAFRREPRNQEIFDELNDDYRDANMQRVPAGRGLHAGHQADRQRHDRGRAGVRRLARVSTATIDGRRARRVPALPAAVLRADAGDLAVLQHVPVRRGRAGEAVRRARGGAGVPSPREPVAAAHGPRARCDFDDVRVRLRRRPAGAARPRPARSRPGRRSRWSARPAPARRRWPSWSPGSTTRRRARSRSTASTCATSPRPTCAGRS